MENIFEYDFEVQYADIDSHNHLTDYAILKYLQEIACLHAASLGHGLYDTPHTRTVWLILYWKMQIISRPSWRDTLHIKTWPSKIDVASCYRDFEIFNKDGERIGIATSKWVLFNIDTHKICRLTPEIQNAFSPVCRRVFENEIEKLKEPNTFNLETNYTILKRDIDTNQHVNNLNYIYFAYEALPVEVFENANFCNIDIMYKKQCLLGDEIVCFYTKVTNNEHIVTIKSKDLKVLHAIVKLKET